MTDPVNLVTLIEQFGNDEAKCREYLEVLRWQNGIECPRCAHQQTTKIANRDQYYCIACHYNFSVMAGTVFNDSHLPLWKWFLCAYLLCESRKGMSANQLKRTLGVSYKTAWYLCHRIRAAMKEAQQEPLAGPVEMDETFVGGKVRGRGWVEGRENKEVVFGIKQRGGELRFFHAEDVKSGTLAKYIKEHVSQDVEVIMTDEMMGYPMALKRAGHSTDKHKTIRHKDHVYVNGNITTNGIESAFSLLKRGIVGSWHKVSAKHLSAYLDEMTFRFNNRNNPYLFRDTMMKLVKAPVLEYKNLTAAA
jgi:transposase-like protein